MVGKTIMLPDKRWGGISGVKSRTFINATLGILSLFGYKRRFSPRFND